MRPNRCSFTSKSTILTCLTVYDKVFGPEIAGESTNAVI